MANGKVVSKVIARKGDNFDLPHPKWHPRNCKSKAESYNKVKPGESKTITTTTTTTKQQKKKKNKKQKKTKTKIKKNKNKKQKQKQKQRQKNNKKKPQSLDGGYILTTKEILKK